MGNAHLVRVSDPIPRIVRVNRARTLQEAVSATEYDMCFWDLESDDEKNIPTCDGEEVEVVFFRIIVPGDSDHISHDDLERECVRHGVRPADPFSLAAVHEADDSLVKRYPTFTHWTDKDDWWELAFDTSGGIPEVSAVPCVLGYGNIWLIACVANETETRLL